MESRGTAACRSGLSQHAHARGFYIDRPGAAWETLVADEFPLHVAKTFGEFSAIAVIGSSMGGYGALKLAFSCPSRYAAVAAVSPAVFPAETIDAVPERNVPGVLGKLHSAMGAGCGDRIAYNSNSVYGRLRANADAIRLAQLPVLIDCGGADEFLLHEGAQFLHQLLVDLEVPHEYRVVDGAGHTGEFTEERTRDAIRFLAAALKRGGRL
ncbi:YqiA/YcfP family alpha/beta fold hydrolase [Leifsonia poae]|uniref:YqiA/YcfP family alpha/beta fold hydrolase n=1 Tax=Leifsonia poae TaxID=110933 RepID=UPI001CC046C7|nr:YqiA/YcfP family alpha/beta fold hydrolase [Leifsonia poae]